MFNVQVKTCDRRWHLTKWYTIGNNIIPFTGLDLHLYRVVPREKFHKHARNKFSIVCGWNQEHVHVNASGDKDLCKGVGTYHVHSSIKLRHIKIFWYMSNLIMQKLSLSKCTYHTQMWSVAIKKLGTGTLYMLYGPLERMDFSASILSTFNFHIMLHCLP